MFEDSTFESAGRIRTRSRGWMIAAFALNASVLLAFVLIPLICPEALPRQAITFLMEAPAPPPPPQPPPQPTVQAAHPPTQMPNGQFIVPRLIPTSIFIAAVPEPAPITVPGGGDPGTPGGTGPFVPSQVAPRVVHPEAPARLRVSSAAEAVLVIQKTMPVYPPIAVAAHVEGTVMLAATISKAGTIENLHVTSGPALLQQAALDAVKTWRYRPYLLNNEPVEVETTVNVIFTLGG